MTSRQAGRRIGTIASERRPAGRNRSGARQVGRRKSEPLSPRDRRRLIQLAACCGIFVLLVAVKLLLPAKMDRINQRLSGMLEQNMDVRAVFSAVGDAVSGRSDVGGTLENVYQAVFNPQDKDGEATETAAVLTGGGARFEEPSALDSLRNFRTGNGGSDGWLEGQAAVESAGAGEELVQPREEVPPAEETAPQASTLAYVMYSDKNLPENVSMEQAILGFDYCTPVMGPLTSNFGYREHPVEGEERFHYGLDIAAGTGTAVGCFADGTVTAVGESSSYGKYCIVTHAGGYSTLYAHCSRITAVSGAAVSEGEKIAEVGETGMATGPHLHFELHKEGAYLNPIYYVSLA